MNGCNARCLSHITHKTAHAEASAHTHTYDLVADIRRRRHQWLGHILRLEGHRYVKEAVRAQLQLGLPGNICMDAPPDLNFDEFTELAKNRKAWKRSVNWKNADTSFSLNSPVRVTFNRTTMNEEELLAVQQAWDEMFAKKKEKAAESSKNKKKKLRRKK